MFFRNFMVKSATAVAATEAEHSSTQALQLRAAAARRRRT
jgi:hypothetical protein